MKKMVVTVVALLAIATASQASLIAYADIGSSNTTTANVVNLGIGQSGQLKDLATGDVMGTLAVSQYFSGPGAGNSTEPGAGTEAYAYFHGIVNVVGYVYSNALSNALVFSGLDAGKQYDLVITGYPGTQPTNTSGGIIIGADSFENVTTVGGAGGGVISTTTVANDTASVLQTAQSVIHFTNISAGADGSFTINNYSVTGYSRLGAVRLEVVPEPMTLALLGLGGLGMMCRRRG